MVDEDSHSIDLSVSGEEGHSTILLAHYIFGFNWGSSFLATLVTPKTIRDLTFVVQFASDQKRFCFFEQPLQLLSKFRYKKQLLIDFGATFELLFKKSFFALIFSIEAFIYDQLY